MTSILWSANQILFSLQSIHEELFMPEAYPET